MVEFFELSRATGWTVNEVLAHPIQLVRDRVAYEQGVEAGFAEVRKAKAKK